MQHVELHRRDDQNHVWTGADLASISQQIESYNNELNILFERMEKIKGPSTGMNVILLYNCCETLVNSD